MLATEMPMARLLRPCSLMFLVEEPCREQLSLKYRGSPSPKGTAQNDRVGVASAKSMKTLRIISRHLLIILITALAGGLLGATLVRLAPGFGIQESDLNTQLSAETRRAMHKEDAGEQNVLSYYGHYLGSLLHGNLGYSRSMDRPVSELFRDRLPDTVESVVIGVAGGWLLGLALAIPASWKRAPVYSASATLISGVFLCIPSAVLALIFLVVGSPGKLAIALVIFPKVFRFSRNLLVKTYTMPHVLTARARGLSSARIFGWHILPNIAAPMLALADAREPGTHQQFFDVIEGERRAYRPVPDDLRNQLPPQTAGVGIGDVEIIAIASHVRIHGSC